MAQAHIFCGASLFLLHKKIVVLVPSEKTRLRVFSFTMNKRSLCLDSVYCINKNALRKFHHRIFLRAFYFTLLLQR